MKKEVFITLIVFTTLVWFIPQKRIFYEQISGWNNHVFYQLYSYNIKKSPIDKLKDIDVFLVKLKHDYLDALKNKEDYNVSINNKYIEAKHKILLAKAYYKNILGEIEESSNIIKFQIPDLLKYRPNTISSKSISSYGTLDSYIKLKKVLNYVFSGKSLDLDENGDFIYDN